MLAGRIDPAIRDTVAAAHDRLAAQQPRLWLHVEDRRLESGEIEALVARADVVLAPYQRFVGSSGVLLWAARAGKPLLTQRFGLIGPLVEMHSLGLAVEANDPSVLADAIARIVAEGPAQFVDRDAARSFIADHTVDRFAAAIFAAMATG